MSRDDAPLAAGDQTLLRRLNATAVLAMLREHGAHTVRELVMRTGLSRPTVDGAELVASGWVAELPPEAGGMGRPARRYRFRADAGFVLGIDVGAHKVLGILGDLDGRIVSTHRLAVDPADGARERLAAAATVAHRCAGPVGMDSVRGVGVATPGVVDASGRVTITDALGEWSGLSLADRLGGLVASPVLVENDATLAALAERRRGAAADVDDVLYILAGQRVGAGILLAGKPRRGHHGAAGELAYADFLGLKPVGLDQPRLAASAMGDESVAIGALRLALDDAHRRLLTI
jgi:hypothetical protein